MRNIAIVGAGVIGRAWSILFARAGFAVALFDLDERALNESKKSIEAGMQELRAGGLLDAAPSSLLQRISLHGSLRDALKGAEYVQENVTERLEAKQAVFVEMDRLAEPEAVLASSTSTFPASSFTKDLPGRHRCLVAHPINPPHVIPVVELSPSPWTSPDVIKRARDIQNQIGQTPVILAKEIPGFLINRLQFVLLNEALRLFEEGYASAEDIDKCIRDALGLRWSVVGPFETIDLNAPGGVTDYASRFAPSVREVAASHRTCTWSDDVVNRLADELRQRVPITQLAERRARRDSRLMGLVGYRRKQ